MAEMYNRAFIVIQRVTVNKNQWSHSPCTATYHVASFPISLRNSFIRQGTNMLPASYKKIPFKLSSNHGTLGCFRFDASSKPVVFVSMKKPSV
jgi:hypothetical protein